MAYEISLFSFRDVPSIKQKYNIMSAKTTTAATATATTTGTYQIQRLYICQALL